MSYGNADFVPVILGTHIGAYNIARCLHEAYGVRSLALGRIALRETAHSAIVDVRARADCIARHGGCARTVAREVTAAPQARQLLRRFVRHARDHHA